MKITKKIVSIVLSAFLAVNCFSFSAFAADENNIENLRNQLYRLISQIDLAVMQVGDLKPYASFERAEKLCRECKSIARDSNSSYEELSEAYNRLKDVSSYMYIDKCSACKAYILASKETNDNLWYDETDWNDFINKREALRVVLGSGRDSDDKFINDAYRDLYSSFVTMTSKYNKAGDLNKDGSVDVNDVTLLQKAVAGYVKLNSAQIMLAKCYSYPGKNYSPVYSAIDSFSLNVSSATKLQKCISDYEDIELNNNPDNMEQFIYTNEFGDKFNLLIFATDNDPRRDELNKKMNELFAEGIFD